MPDAKREGVFHTTYRPYVDEFRTALVELADAA
jgi:hypothetical protein